MIAAPVGVGIMSSLRTAALRIYTSNYKCPMTMVAGFRPLPRLKLLASGARTPALIAVKPVTSDSFRSTRRICEGSPPIQSTRWLTRGSRPLAPGPGVCSVSRPCGGISWYPRGCRRWCSGSLPTSFLSPAGVSESLLLAVPSVMWSLKLAHSLNPAQSQINVIRAPAGQLSAGLGHVHPQLKVGPLRSRPWDVTDFVAIWY